jgi:hypothetical protein
VRVGRARIAHVPRELVGEDPVGFPLLMPPQPRPGADYEFFEFLALLFGRPLRAVRRSPAQVRYRLAVARAPADEQHICWDGVQEPRARSPVTGMDTMTGAHSLRYPRVPSASTDKCVGSRSRPAVRKVTAASSSWPTELAGCRKLDSKAGSLSGLNSAAVFVQRLTCFDCGPRPRWQSFTLLAARVGRSAWRRPGRARHVPVETVIPASHSQSRS